MGYSPWGHKESDTTELVTQRHTHTQTHTHRASQVEPVVKNLPANAGNKRDMGLIPGLERSPEGENGNLFQYSCPENSMDRGAQQAI